MTLELNIRCATLDDISTLTPLIEESVRALTANHYSARQIDSAMKYIYGIDRQLIEDKSYFVAEFGGEAVGCGGWSKRKKLFGGDQMEASKDNLLDPVTDPAKIRAFFVHPGWARRGIGGQLIEWCEKEAHLNGFWHIELMATLTGEALYTKYGYMAAESVETSMPDGTPFPIIRMIKTLI